MTDACFQGWTPKDSEALKRSMKRWGATPKAHLTSLYERPLGPGAEPSEEWDRAAAISSTVTKSRGQGGRGGGSSARESGTRSQDGRKNCADKAEVMSDGTAEADPSVLRRGGTRLVRWPFRYAQAAQRDSDEALKSISSKYSRLDMCTIFLKM
jgi:hypothetical protein